MSGNGYSYLSLAGYTLERGAAFVPAEIMIRIGNDAGWLWIPQKSINRTDLVCILFKRQDMFIAEAFLKTLLIYDNHTVYSD